MKEMQVFGIALKDYPVRESMRMVDAFLQEAKVNTVVFLSLEDLMKAGEDEELREDLLSVDLTVPISEEILQAAGIAGRGRIAEVREGALYKALLKKISSEKRSAFILAQNEEHAEALVSHLSSEAPGLTVLGHYAFEELEGDPEVVVNEINSTFPDIIFSDLPSGEQARFLRDHNTKLNARLWVALQDEMLNADKNQTPGIGRLRQWIRSKMFLHRVSRFLTGKDQKGENS